MRSEIHHIFVTTNEFEFHFRAFKLPLTIERNTSKMNNIRGSKQSNQQKRVLSIQSHVVHGYVGNKSATFPLQVIKKKEENHENSIR